MTDTPEKPSRSEKSAPSDKSGWTGKAALAGAAIGSAALAAALLYASRRKEPTDKSTAVPITPAETD